MKSMIEVIFIKIVAEFTSANPEYRISTEPFDDFAGTKVRMTRECPTAGEISVNKTYSNQSLYCLRLSDLINVISRDLVDMQRQLIATINNTPSTRMHIWYRQAYDRHISPELAVLREQMQRAEREAFMPRLYGHGAGMPPPTEDHVVRYAPRPLEYSNRSGTTHISGNEEYATRIPAPMPISTFSKSIRGKKLDYTVIDDVDGKQEPTEQTFKGTCRIERGGEE